VSELKRGARIVCFGVFEFDTRSGELRREGRVEPRLRDQAAQVLSMLLERPREIVTREELRSRLWLSDTFVDFDHGLNTAINQLRNALGDSAANPRFIQTVPRRGYRFIAPVDTRVDAGAGPNLAARTVQGDDGSQLAMDQTDPHEADLPAARPLLLSDARDLPPIRSQTVRILFSLIQAIYLTFYIVSLGRLSQLDEILTVSGKLAHVVLVTVIVTAAVGIPVRLYLLAAMAFNYRGLNGKFETLFPALLVLDELWALAPFLIAQQIGTGLALAATAALLYLPFSQRTLLLMGSVGPAN
jgi:DNA-binding winged helix-turn-helix (wHTH) protein